MGHIHALRRAFAVPGLALIAAVAPAQTTSSAHDYPTVARVEYVQECIRRNRGDLQYLYKCSCAIDEIARALSYDEYVEASTFARYSGLAGEGGAIFRDSDEAKAKAKRYRGLEADAYRTCGFGHAPPQ